MSSSPLNRHRQLSPTASVKVSPLCLGCMTFGTEQQEKYGKITKETARAILDEFYNQGGNFLDTANTYQNGQSEQWVGEWMRQRQNRDEIVLATKYTALNKPNAHIKSNYGGNSVKTMRLSIEESLKNLQTSYIDLYYVHMWEYTTSIPELMHALNDLVSLGKINYLGISDTPAWIVAKANQYARDHGLRQFAVYQGMWNASMRDFERDIIPMARDEGMALCPYGTLNQGRFQTEEAFKEREKHNDGRNFIPTSQHDKDVSKKLENLANRKGCNLLDIALAYPMQKTTYVFPIVGGRKLEHIKANIESLKASLSEADIDEIENAYHFDPGFPHTFLSFTLFDPEAKPKMAQFPQDMPMPKGRGTFDWVEPPRPIKPVQSEQLERSCEQMR